MGIHGRMFLAGEWTGVTSGGFLFLWGLVALISAGRYRCLAGEEELALKDGGWFAGRTCAAFAEWRWLSIGG